MNVVIGLIKLALWLRDFLEKRKLVSSAQNEIIAQVLVKRSYDIDKGKSARLLQRQLDSTGFVYDGDEFVRPD